MLLVDLGMQSSIKSVLNKEEFQKLIFHLKEVLNILKTVEKTDIKKIEDIIQVKILQEILNKKEKELKEKGNFEEYREIYFLEDDLLEAMDEIKEAFYGLSIWYNFEKAIRILERMYRSKYE